MEKQGRSYSLEQKLDTLYQFKHSGKSMRAFTKDFGIAFVTLKKWLGLEQLEDFKALEPSHEWKRYSQDTKNAAVHDRLVNGLSQLDIVKKYQISSTSVLRRWVNQYTNGKEIKATSKGQTTHMKQGRTTSYQERIEIAQYALAHEKDYHTTANHFNVSYQQVYTWVRKYEKDGINALQDRRGKRLNREPEELSEKERLELRIKELEERNDFLETREDLAKKLREIQRRNQ
ncbi:helix-turn-helix domain-containing protein [Furfurilactobacillus rossiae]|uniref:helix-turn-helix domain-containing protein n=1 Tax=Furfurilactobacillus rossiae TaxID=231049 RepID=UPI001266048D|nr:helix-turn-helix domain-containing protein [Furfurilactobacillus rossiae]QFR66377.1 helix-turn-helix domain-containing protein [Furfurilactobacillus rossiae]QFR66779.1 helix-turn-helix domain-containing protein [Furfurilactobacillus rossiae]QLE61831.1 Transposase ISLasa7 IS3 [Furfurilactobacillus rossiae]QLE62262.1 Transposase ISLasa7 IS3 [Furfurilactobacillus rossiae]